MTRCELDEKNEAEVTKFENVYGYTGEGLMTVTKRGLKICRECAETYFDGTEDFPGTNPL